MNEILIYLLLSLLILFSLLSVLIKNTLKAVISLAAASASLTTLIFLFGAPLAAVFELSVCAGLITVIFISVISLTKPSNAEEELTDTKKRIRRYIYLPIILIIVALLLFLSKPVYNYIISSSTLIDGNVHDVIWNRKTDIFGQIVIILAGVLGVVILFKEGNKK